MSCSMASSAVRAGGSMWRKCGALATAAAAAAAVTKGSEAKEAGEKRGAARERF